MPGGMVVASEGICGFESRISSTLVLNRAARAGRVSPDCAVYSTNSPGLKFGLAGRGVIASAVNSGMKSGFPGSAVGVFGCCAVSAGVQAWNAKHAKARVAIFLLLNDCIFFSIRFSEYIRPFFTDT